MMLESNVLSIQQWESPTKIHKLRSFLGFVNCYCQFIKGHSIKAAHFIDFLKKNQAWNWTNKCQQTFKDLKKAITKKLVLSLNNHSKPFKVHTNASNFAIGDVLMQEEHSIAYESKKLNDIE